MNIAWTGLKDEMGSHTAEQVAQMHSMTVLHGSLRTNDIESGRRGKEHYLRTPSLQGVTVTGGTGDEYRI